MPQLDLFIFSHITIQATIGFLVVAGIIWNTALINIFKSLKTRYTYIKITLNDSNNAVAILAKKNIKQHQNKEILKIEDTVVKYIAKVYKYDE